MSRPITFAARAAVAVLAVVLAGCGEDETKASSDEPEPNRVMELDTTAAVRLAERTTRQLEDVVYEGRITFPMPKRNVEGRGRVTIVAADQCQLDIRTQEFGKVVVRLVDGHGYVLADPDLWSELLDLPAKELAQVDGKWLGGPLPEDEWDCFDDVFGQARDKLSPCFFAGERSEVGDTPVRVVECRAMTDGTQKFYISTVDEPLIVRRTGQTDYGPFDVELIDMNTGATVRSPPEDDVIDGTRTV